MVKKIKYFDCPHAKLVPLQCVSSCYWAQSLKTLLNLRASGQPYVVCLDGELGHHCDPELCPLYVNHMVQNIDVYKKQR